MASDDVPNPEMQGTAGPVRQYQGSECALLFRYRCRIQPEGTRGAACLAGSQPRCHFTFYACLSLGKLLRHSHTGTTMHQPNLFLVISAGQAHPLRVSRCQIVDIKL